jgi:hypothetical protein
MRTRHGSGAVCHGLKARQRRASKPEDGEQEVKSKVRADQKLWVQEYDESELGLFGLLKWGRARSRGGGKAELELALLFFCL